jgi:homoserine kinase type II
MLDPLEPWGLDLKDYHTELKIPGSPERCVSRSVVEDTEGRLWLLERIASGQTSHRRKIAKSLNLLGKAGLRRLLEYRQDVNGEFISEIMGFYWQLSPFFKSDILPRPDYISAGQRGTELAAFLGELYSLSEVVVLSDRAPMDDLNGFILNFLDKVADFQPGILAAIKSYAESILPVISACNQLPQKFCHGDFHPLNVLWKGQCAGAVIDWEFCGVRTELYDMANLIGCAGFEHPDALENKFVLSFISGMKASGIQNSSIELLPVFTAALRFAWLSEWLRKKDREMLAMELDYIALLLENKEKYKKIWMNAFN